MRKLSSEKKVDVIGTILTYSPKEAEVSRIDFEGPRIAIYAKKPEAFVDQSHLIAEMVNILHKRIVIRSDPLVRLSEEETLAFIKKLVPTEAKIANITFDHAVGEVIVEADNPTVLTSKESNFYQQVIKVTKWRPRVLKHPTIPSKVITYLRHHLQQKAMEREKILRSIGERIFRPKIFTSEEIRITALGGFQQVGRSCILFNTSESSILLDCGINPGAISPIDAFPRIDLNEFNLSELDAVVITHAHLDHCGFLPFLFKYGYKGPVYCSEPTLSLMFLLQMDYIDVLLSKGLPIPYNKEDVKSVINHAITLPYGSVTDISPDIKLTLYNAGHTLGSSIVHLHVGEGLYNVVYTGDYKFMRTILHEPANFRFPRVETLITEATYGSPEDAMPPRVEVEVALASIINETLKKGGKVLIPALAVGRAQEVMLTLDSHMRAGNIMEVPIFTDGMISEVTAIYTAHPEYLSRDLYREILELGKSPFESECFTMVKNASERRSVIEGGPCIIIATSGMLEGGPVLEYFRELAPNDENAIIFVSYQIEGTLGHRIRHGAKEVQLMGESGKIELIKVNSRVESLEGFSGHSDRGQLIRYITRVVPRPRKVIACHGERSKCLNVASTIRRALMIETSAPSVLDSMKLQ